LSTELTPHGGLTPAQIQVIAGYARGLTMEEVGKDLEISPRAVRGHTARAARRLQIDGPRLSVLVDYAYRHGAFAEVPDLAPGMTTPSAYRLGGPRSGPCNAWPAGWVPAPPPPSSALSGRRSASTAAGFMTGSAHPTPARYCPRSRPPTHAAGSPGQ
jgi:DNA-binding CsgD family transcriptional regulator